MNRYTVIWHREAQDELAALWLSSLDRAAVTSAADQIDRELADSPLAKAAEIREGLYAIIIAPLRAVFEVDEGDRMVRVLRTRLTRK